MQSRRGLYRLANRTFRYPVYVAIELVWLVGALGAVAFEIRNSTALVWPIAFILIASSLAHSGRMAMLHPWLLLKSFLLGLVAFGILVAAQSGLGYPTSPFLIAALLASTHYFWLGEQWTRARAEDNLRDVNRAV